MVFVPIKQIKIILQLSATNFNNFYLFQFLKVYGNYSCIIDQSRKKKILEVSYFLICRLMFHPLSNSLNVLIFKKLKMRIISLGLHLR
jgi:hypothetical protein